MGPFDHLTGIVDAFRDPDVDELTLATLNHDRVIEHTLRDARATISDGFEDPFGTLQIWSDNYSVPQRKVLKLHGSID
jgi:hypothetical protein